MADGAGWGPAPLFDRSGPADGAATWAEAPDGLRLRLAHWGRDAPRGTVLVFTGRGEHVEKYARLALDLRARGWATLTCDWRGQGLSERPMVEGPFRDYQKDVAALVAEGRALGLPEPWFLLAHSMGGAIGLRALHEGLGVASAAFSAPMWGLSMAGFRPALRPPEGLPPGVRRIVDRVLPPEDAPRLRLREIVAAGRDGVPYLLCCDFAGNTLTTDRETFEWMRGHLAAHPELATGRSSLHWTNEALREMAALLRVPAPKVPVLVVMGSDEVVVDPARVRRRLRSWPEAKLLVLAGARHEPLMEAPRLRAQAIGAIAAHFEAAVSSSGR
ncbi:alpha/beta fold hydrolase [Rubellimicrobium roseum]|uniref:Alpha/beta hydrolase n=1 Tax=Rubellimicrobium roseum TaxID=687525 RepID=A0A5C4NAY1_9RHOB|nr:alpha/beta hydrolase [Rubellimicrobium roseum]TNC70873.1 alpha/beta hydrolase [Rubellimicrobium roseum]